MKVIESTLIDLVEGSYVSKKGVYYFFDDFIISEINEGAIFNWKEGKEIIAVAKDYYGDKLSICYIANRVNEYSVVPTDWPKFFKEGNRVNGFAIVTQSYKGWGNALIEKLFVNSKMERFKNLYQAVEWARKTNQIARQSSFPLNKSHPPL